MDNLKGVLRKNYPLAPLTWFKVGGEAQFFFKPLDLEDLSLFLSKNEDPLFLIGAGSNILIRDGGIEGTVVKLGQNFASIEYREEEEKLIVGAACLNYSLAKFCENNSIGGFEFLIGIPGTAGGGVAMNAGSYGAEFKDIVLEIKILDSKGKFQKISNGEIGFRYRKTSLPKDFIVTEVIFKAVKKNRESISSDMKKIIEAREKTQPIKTRTGGSTFANPPGDKAWRLIDEAGLSGMRIGGAYMSELHCNFMVNDGSARASDLENLGELVREKVFKKSGVDLEWEIKRIGKKI